VASCPTREDNLPPERVYYLRYRVSYTRELRAITPVHVSVATAPDCALFYEVLRQSEEHPFHVAHMEFVAETNTTVLLAIGHLHVGGVNISMLVNDVRVCTSYPRYGRQQGVAGDELGYLVQMSQCVNESTGPVHWKEGDRIRIESWYDASPHDPRLLYSDGTHLNVMGYMYLAYTRASPPNSPSLAAGVTQRVDMMAPMDLKQSVVRGTRVWTRVPATQDLRGVGS